MQEFNLFPRPESAHMMWVALFAVGIVVLALQFRKIQPSGYPWWARLALLIGILLVGHGLQHAMGLRGLPNIAQITLFPMVQGALANDYYMYFHSTGMDMREASDLGNSWGWIHAIVIWMVVFALIFSWSHLRPAKSRVIYGDDEDSTTANTAGTVMESKEKAI